ncbi:DUF3301 domain-containing protein [Rhodanobacter glycinis]|uniref:DUF3301 domain-containing protein n=1 Tax=Rhodanobacter glycinis TaxID=582702 RepID=A0A5B9DWT5_9GAMM|nr:DUF3301 domain-containing protein [Rhodanobacter glycinis]QEE23849.1 DUF3301 domain-containing protein [Rhodanobacter glycinis]
MDGLFELLPLLILLAIVGLWLKLSRAREMAVAEARRQCERHGLQLLDETVGLSGVRVRPVHGQRRLERCYSFEVSIDGNDREPGRLWMVGSHFTGLSLPTIEARMRDDHDGPGTPPRTSNVIPLPPRDGQRRLH